MSQLKQDEWPRDGEPTTTEEQVSPDAPPEQSPTPRHSRIRGDGLDTQDTQPNNGVPPEADADHRVPS